MGLFGGITDALFGGEQEVKTKIQFPPYVKELTPLLTQQAKQVTGRTGEEAAAGFSPDTMAGFTQMRDLAKNDPTGYFDALGFGKEAITSGFDPSQPWNEKLVEATLSDFDRAAQMDRERAARDQAGRGAFGSRAYIADREQDRDLREQRTRMAEELRESGINRRQQAANALASLAGSERGEAIRGAGLLDQVGRRQEGREQQVLDYPLDLMQRLGSIVSSAPYSTSTQQDTGGNILSQLAGAATAASGFFADGGKVDTDEMRYQDGGAVDTQRVAKIIDAYMRAAGDRGELERAYRDATGRNIAKSMWGLQAEDRAVQGAFQRPSPNAPRSESDREERTGPQTRQIQPLENNPLTRTQQILSDIEEKQSARDRMLQRAREREPGQENTIRDYIKGMDWDPWGVGELGQSYGAADASTPDLERLVAPEPDSTAPRGAFPRAKAAEGAFVPIPRARPRQASADIDPEILSSVVPEPKPSRGRAQPQVDPSPTINAPSRPQPQVEAADDVQGAFAQWLNNPITLLGLNMIASDQPGLVGAFGDAALKTSGVLSKREQQERQREIEERREKRADEAIDIDRQRLKEQTRLEEERLGLRKRENETEQEWRERKAEIEDEKLKLERMLKTAQVENLRRGQPARQQDDPFMKELAQNYAAAIVEAETIGDVEMADRLRRQFAIQTGAVSPPELGAETVGAD